MTLLSVVKDVCSTVGVLLPTSVFNNSIDKRTMSEMVTLANEMAQSIAYDNSDWNVLKSFGTFVGDGVTQAFDFPADYKRLLLESDFWLSSSTSQPMMFVPSVNDWMRRRSELRNDAWGEWMILGGKVNILPVMRGPIAEIPAVPEDPGPPYVPPSPMIPGRPAVTASYAYLSKNCISLASGGYADVFVSDNDTFRLDERLLKLGMIWRWKSQKGSPYAEDLGSFTDAMSFAMGKDQPAPIMIGRTPISANARIAYPWPVPT